MTKEQIEILRGIKGRVHSRESFGTVDGPGIRFVLFMQGCPLTCLYCHNPDSTPFDGGETWTAGQVTDEILRYGNFISKGGATFSGGEPLAQPKFLAAILALLKEEGVHTAIDTSGCYTVEMPFVEQAVQLADLIMLDIKGANNERSLQISGAGNDNAFHLLDYCEQIGKPVWIRHVVLQQYTLNEKELKMLAKRLKKYTCIEMIEILAFHKMGEHKWEELGYDYQLADIPATTKEEAQMAKDIFIEEGFKVQ